MRWAVFQVLGVGWGSNGGREIFDAVMLGACLTQQTWERKMSELGTMGEKN